MNSFTLALRAIGTNLAMRLYIPAVIIVSLAAALIVAGGLWLTTYSTWWWLLLVPITIFACVIIGLEVIVFLLIRHVRPAQTKEQKRAVASFVDAIQNIADIAGTPKFIVLFRVIRSITAPSKDSYLADIAKNKQLANDFRQLQRSFDDVIVIK